jgi:hypothetical protein
MTPRVRTFTATEMGWVKHSSMDGEVWEMPDGKLYAHFDGSEPILTVLDYEWIDYYRKGPYG